VSGFWSAAESLINTGSFWEKQKPSHTFTGTLFSPMFIDHIIRETDEGRIAVDLVVHRPAVIVDLGLFLFVIWLIYTCGIFADPAFREIVQLVKANSLPRPEIL
jgi:uncharacterized transporter YbjL